MARAVSAVVHHSLPVEQAMEALRADPAAV
jgi:hypothetical protein